MRIYLVGGPKHGTKLQVPDGIGEIHVPEVNEHPIWVLESMSDPVRAEPMSTRTIVYYEQPGLERDGCAVFQNTHPVPSGYRFEYAADDSYRHNPEDPSVEDLIRAIDDVLGQ